LEKNFNTPLRREVSSSVDGSVFGPLSRLVSSISMGVGGGGRGAGGTSRIVDISQSV